MSLLTEPRSVASAGKTERWVGFGGAVLLAVAAFLGGALPLMQADWVSPATIWRERNGPASLIFWLLGSALLVWAWVRARKLPLDGRWVLVTALLWVLPLLLAPPLASRDVYPYSCQGEVFAAGLDPYRYGVAVLPCQWTDLVTPMWRRTPTPYGPLFVALAGGVAAVTDHLWASIIGFRVIAVAGIALSAVSLHTLARRAGVDPARGLWLGLATPLVGIHLASGVHNDALMLGLLLAGLAVVVPGSYRRLCAAGLLIGLAVAIKVTAIVALPFAALLFLRAPFRWRAFWPVGLLGSAAAALAIAGVTLAAGLDFGWVAALSGSGESINWLSPPTAVGQTVEYLGRPFGLDLDLIPVTRVIGLALLPFVLIAIWWRARLRLTPDAVLWHAGLALAATVALSPVVHPWYVIWPLALLGLFAAAERGVVFVTATLPFVVLPDGTGLAKFTKIPGAWIMAGFAIWYAVRVLRAPAGSGRVPPAVPGSGPVPPPDR